MDADWWLEIMVLQVSVRICSVQSSLSGLNKTARNMGLDFEMCSAACLYRRGRP